MTVFDLTAPAEKDVRLVEEQHRAALLGGIEYALQVLFAFADVLTDHLAEIDAIEVDAEVGCDHFGGHCLAGAALATKKSALMPRPRAPRVANPRFRHRRPVPHLLRDLAQRVDLAVGKYPGLSAGSALHALGEPFEPGARLHPAGVPQFRGKVAGAAVRASASAASML